MIHYRLKLSYLITLSLVVISCGGSSSDPITSEVKTPANTIASGSFHAKMIKYFLHRKFAVQNFYLASNSCREREFTKAV